MDALNRGPGIEGARPPAAGALATCLALARSAAPGAREMLFAALDGPDARMQAAAARAIALAGRRDDVARLVASLPRLADEVAAEIVRNADALARALREVLASGPAAARANAVEILRRAGRVSLAYLLVEAISDPDAGVAQDALDALARLVAGVRREAVAGAGNLGLSRDEIEARRFALLDPLLAHLSDLSRPQPDALMLLAMGLDPRANDLLFGVLDSRRDPRADALDRLLRNAASPHVVSFLFDALRDRRVASLAAGVFRSRRDLPFVRATLMNARFFADHRVRESLRALDGLDALRAREDGGPRPDVFAHARLALRAIHFVVLTGTPAADKQAFVESVASAALPAFVTGLAQSVATALAAGRPPEEISPALVWLEGEMGPRAARGADAASAASGAAVEVPELELPWAHPEAQSLPADAFTQFFNAFDRLDDATKVLAAENLKRLGPAQLERLDAELAGVAPDRRLKAVKIVVALHREHDLEGALLALASDADRRVRATVVKALGILEDEPAVRALLDAVTDADRRVVANSVEAIEEIGRDELAGLVRILAAHPNNRIRANAVKALWALGARDAAALLDAMLASDDEMMRLSATWVLGEVDHPRRIEMLADVAANDPSERVRAKARSILGDGG